MTLLCTKESERVKLQVDLDRLKSQRERNRLGQFATPTDLALDILQCAKSLSRRCKSIRFMDPAFGTGSFYSALVKTFPSSRIARARAFEVDRHYGDPTRRLWKSTPLELTIADFTNSKLPSADSERFNLIICNPPYVRHHHIASGEKLRLQQRTQEICNIRLSGLAGLYCHFLGQSYGWMTDNGLAAWLVPSEFMDVNYGASVKAFLLDSVALLRIHRFDPKEVQFDDALVSSAVVWFRKNTPTSDHMVEFTYGGTLCKPHESKTIPVATLRQEAKWTRFPRSRIRQNTNGPKLADYFTVRRGLATGNNKFFILTRDKLEEKNLPLNCFRPILPSPRFLTTDQIEADENGYPLITPQLFLLNCRLSEADIKKQYPKLHAYLQEGSQTGVRDRYLCQHRTPWYSQEDRPPSLFMCTYIGRSDTKNGRPFRFILNRSKATVTNTYLVMYPNPRLAKALSADPELTVRVWQILNAISPDAMLDEGRVYGGGMHKMEPKELANVLADELCAILPHAPSRAQQTELFNDTF